MAYSLSKRRFSRDYAPMGVVAVLLVVLLALLPSALNLPRSNPTETLEYAPVVPDDVTPTSAVGNLSSLGTAGSRGITGPVPPEAPALGGRAKSPSTKQCVGSPSRQSEDPMAPPCVAFFDGDNGGATYNGVSANEVRVLFFFDGGGYGGHGTSSLGAEPIPIDKFFDLGQPPESEDEYVGVRVLRLYQKYFNDRYQTYNRTVRFFLHYSKQAFSAEDRRAAAVEGISKVKPFAAINYAGSNGDAYLAMMLRRNVAVFLTGGGGTSGGIGQSASYYSGHPGFVWSYQPSVQQRAEMFVSYVCSKVVGFPVSFTGNPEEMGSVRRLGIIWVDNPNEPGYRMFKQLVRSGVESCGGKIEAEGSFVFSYGCPQFPAGREAFPQENMANFKGKVTTILWLGGFECRQSQAGAAIGYRPEVVLAGDGGAEGNADSRFQDQSFWQNVRVVTTYVRQDDLEKGRACYEAATEADPSVPSIDARHYACFFYPDVRILFTGIQSAGPKLTPKKLDAGFHAIPKIASSSPHQEACFFLTDDYTCVKDAQAQWWDPSGTYPGTDGSGCYKKMEEGRRYLSGSWPREDVDKRRSVTSDTCNIPGSDF